MSNVFFSVSVSLDGYLVPPGMDMEHAGDPTYEDWAAQWGKLQSWLFPTRLFRERLKLGEGGETGTDNHIVEHTFRRTGVSIMGKRMFELGERMWPEEAPFHTPVFVLTSQVREPWDGPAVPRSTSSTTASRARSGKRAPRPAIATSASPAAPTRSSVTSAPV